MDIVERIRNAVKKSPTPYMIRQNDQIVKLRQYAIELEAAVASGDMRLIAEKSAQSRAYLDHLKATEDARAVYEAMIAAYVEFGKPLTGSPKQQGVSDERAD